MACGLSVVLNCKRSLLRFVQSRHLSFRQSLAYLEQPSTLSADPAAVLEQAATFYQRQRDLYPEALCHLKQRGLHDPAQIKELRIYAPGGSLCRHFTAQGYSFCLLQGLGLLDSQGCDAFYRRVVFPCCQGGRSSISTAAVSLPPSPNDSSPAPRVACMPGSRFHPLPEVILIEGLLDYAVFRQEGCRQVTCTLGSHFNADQFLI